MPGVGQSAMAVARSCDTISNAVHLSIDMQNIFSSAGIWPTPWMDRVVPGIVRLVAHDTARTVFTRFITPVSADDRPGSGQRYFARWDCATQPRLPRGALDIVSPLARFIPPATVIDKPGYSAFFASPFSPSSRKRTSTLSSSRDPRRMFACSPRFWTQSIAACARLSWKTGSAARPTKVTMP
jgi:hypothetical protein